MHPCKIGGKKREFLEPFYTRQCIFHCSRETTHLLRLRKNFFLSGDRVKDDTQLVDFYLARIRVNYRGDGGGLAHEYVLVLLYEPAFIVI